MKIIVPFLLALEAVWALHLIEHHAEFDKISGNENVTTAVSIALNEEVKQRSKREVILATTALATFLWSLVTVEAVVTTVAAAGVAVAAATMLDKDDSAGSKLLPEPSLVFPVPASDQGSLLDKATWPGYPNGKPSDSERRNMKCPIQESKEDSKASVLPSPNGGTSHLTDITVFVAGGVPSAAVTAPHFVALEDWLIDSPFCGGSIIASRWILTAAHCLDDYLIFPSLLKIRAGSLLAGRGGYLYLAYRVIQHPSYALATPFKSVSPLDIGLIQTCIEINMVPGLVQTIGYSGVHPASLNSLNSPPTPFLFEGFGVINTNGAPANILQKTILPYVSHDNCEHRYLGYDISESFICAGGLPDTGLCKGDSGSPIVFLGHVVGVLSGSPKEGLTCTEPLKPGLFAPVDSHYVTLTMTFWNSR